MRKDVWVDNDSSALVITSTTGSRAIDDDFAETPRLWKKAREAGEAWVVDCEEIASVLRVVVDEDLTELEEQAILESFEGGLHIPDGELVITGGFQIDEDLEDDYCLRTVDVPAGWYRARLSVLIGSEQGPYEFDGDSLEEFWTRTRGKRKPKWVKGEADGFVVDYLLELTTVDGPLPGPKGKTDLAWGEKMKVPEICPDAIVVKEVEGYQDPREIEQTDLHYIHDVPGLTSQLKLCPLDRPVESRLILAYWVAWAAGETHPCVFIERCGDWTCDWPGFKEGIKETRTGDGWRIDIEGMNARFSQFGHLRIVEELVRDLPDGSILELRSADTESEDETIFHRYRGRIQGGAWQIEEVHPKMDGDTLEAMLEVALEMESGVPFILRDADERDRVLEACRERDFLLMDKPPTVKGLTVSVTKKNAELRPFLFARVFEARFRGEIPLMDRDDDTESWDDAMNLIGGAGARWATGEPVFEGQFATFTRGDLAQALPIFPLPLLEFESDLAGLGFEWVGDLNSTQTFAACFRGYARAGSGIYAAVITNGSWSTSYDFYSDLESGWSLTTTRSEESRQDSDKRMKTFKIEIPGTTAERLAIHEKKLGQVLEKYGAPKPAEASLEGFARALDAFMKKHFG